MNRNKARNNPKLEVNVYCITNTENQKKYVGITYKAINRRWLEHVREARSGSSNRALCFAILKHGADAFRVESLCVARDWQHACELEDQYIRDLATFANTGHGYNMTMGGEGVIGNVISDDLRERMTAGNLRVAAARAEVVRPAIEMLLQDGFENYLHFAERMNKAGIPTFRGKKGWGTTQVQLLFKRLGMDTNLYDRLALEDRKKLKFLDTIRNNAQQYQRSIEDQFAQVWSVNQGSIKDLARALTVARVPTMQGKPWGPSSARLFAQRLGYDVEALAANGLSKCAIARPLVANNVRYESLKQAETITGDKHIVRSIRSGRPGFYYVDEGPRQKPERKKRQPPTPVWVQGAVYPHAAEAGRALGVKPDTITNRCRSAAFSDHYFCDEGGAPVHGG